MASDYHTFRVCDACMDPSEWHDVHKVAGWDDDHETAIETAATQFASDQCDYDALNISRFQTGVDLTVEGPDGNVWHVHVTAEARLAWFTNTSKPARETTTPQPPGDGQNPEEKPC